jgi:hypothetical protein
MDAFALHYNNIYGHMVNSQYAGKLSIQNPSVHRGTQFESSAIIGRTSHGCDPPLKP